MHDILRQVYDRTIELFKADDRVLAAYMSGSAFTKSEDALSDVDPVFFVRPDCFERIDKELYGFFDDLCDEIVLYWPERFNCATWKNYAVIFVKDSVLLQYDITIEPAAVKEPRCILPEQLIFDKTGSLLDTVGPAAAVEKSRDEIRHVIDTYWVWAYIQAKYIKRKDFVKLVYVQQELFNAHCKLLGFLHDELNPSDWWCLTVKKVKDTRSREVLLSYLTHQDVDSVVSKVEEQTVVFLEDTKKCCEKYHLPVPANTQQKVLDHLCASIRSE